MWAVKKGALVFYFGRILSIPTDLAGVSVLKEFSNFRKKAKMRTDNMFHRPAVRSNFYFF